jgi:tetratricopeptide (TPR) repeat protein
MSLFWQTMPNAYLLTRQNVLTFRDRRLATRSVGLLRFVAYLWWKREYYPNACWVGPEELLRILEHPSPKQMQRYVDMLDSAQMPLIEYRSKTTGPWRLALPAKQLEIDINAEALTNWLNFDPARMDTAQANLQMGELEANLREALLVDAIHAEQGVDSQDGHQAVAAYRTLLNMPGTSDVMKASLLQRLCLLHRQWQDFSAWKEDLARLDDLLSQGILNQGDFDARRRLLQMFLLYDEGRREDACHLLERIDPSEIRDVYTLGRYHNAMGLAATWRLDKSCSLKTSGCHGAESACGLNAALDHYSKALGYALAVNDYAGLEGISFNIGNVLRRCLDGSKDIDDDAHLHDAARWIGLCEMICHRFGVGGATQGSRLILVDLAFQRNLDFATVNRWVGGVYSNYVDFPGLLMNTLADTVRRNHRLEQAECCQLLTRYYEQCAEFSRAVWYREEAIAIYRELGRNDKVAALKSSTPRKL